MQLPSPSVLLPESPVSEWTAFNIRTAPGLYAYRHIQANGLLESHLFHDGDLSIEQRSDLLSNTVALRKPLAALSLFLGVVALEDLIRDLAGRLADLSNIAQYFPRLSVLRAKEISRPADKAFKRLDTDPAVMLDPEELNKLFKLALDIEPVPESEYWHLRDLALLRHTVAHHGAVIRDVDASRFTHFIVRPGRVINPPIDFVRSELTYLYKLGCTIEREIQGAVFSRVIKTHGVGWSSSPPQAVVELVELFDFLGFIETTSEPVGYSEPGSALRARQVAETARIRAVLIRRCIEELVVRHGS